MERCCSIVQPVLKIMTVLCAHSGTINSFKENHSPDFDNISKIAKVNLSASVNRHGGVFGGWSSCQSDHI